MAETSGFTTDLPQSAYLSLSIRRAISAAQQRSHRYVTLEHLLMALLDDPSAIEILEGLRADLPAIRVAISDAVNRNLATLYTPGEFDLRASYKVERVLQTASDDADRLGCHEVDAAFVIAALARETDNPVPGILKQNGVAYTSAVTWLYANRGMSLTSRSKRSHEQAVSAREQMPATRTVSPAPAEAQPSAHPSSTTEAGPTLQEALAEVEAAPAESEPDDEEPIELDLEIVEDAPSEHSPNVSQQAAGADTLDSAVESSPIAEEATPQRHPHPVPPRPAEPKRQRIERGGNSPPTPRAGPIPAPGTTQNLTRPVTDQDQRDKGAAARALQRRPEPQVPPPSRLDEMRLGGGVGKAASKRSTSAPASPAPAKKRARTRGQTASAQARGGIAENQRARARRQPRPHEVLIGRLLENVPRRMRAEIPEHVEVRISREETKALARAMEGRAEPVRHDIMISQTMSVALRAPDGGFSIELLSPETQWIFESAHDAETYGRWRWVVTPHSPGRRRLQLIVASRSIGQNGLIGDTALPDQIITIRVRTNYWRNLVLGLQWLIAMVLGGIVTELAMAGIRMFNP